MQIIPLPNRHPKMKALSNIEEYLVPGLQFKKTKEVYQILPSVKKVTHDKKN